MIYGVTGYKQSGKSEAAKHLASKGFTRLNFKDALVKEMKERFPELLEAIHDNYHVDPSPFNYEIDELFDVKPPLMRALMQNYGTDVRRKDDPNYWVKQWENAYCAMHPADVVVDDVRFLNEADAIRRYGGKIIRIVRSDITTGGDHQSETEQDSIEADHTIKVGYGELDKLYEELDKILND